MSDEEEFYDSLEELETDFNGTNKPTNESAGFDDSETIPFYNREAVRSEVCLAPKKSVTQMQKEKRIKKPFPPPKEKTVNRTYHEIFLKRCSLQSQLTRNISESDLSSTIQLQSPISPSTRSQGFYNSDTGTAGSKCSSPRNSPFIIVSESYLMNPAKKLVNKEPETNQKLLLLKKRISYGKTVSDKNRLSIKEKNILPNLKTA
ncbi:uncharacterized protein LOC109594751 [Aethina tumida]|uniref:uncharacterized protein LOC109594751 n=1 Tax=Aethina tumida TaxID=116153 RepID=UPI002148357D|nr:uncharacterized protein LOC109594751 [Aethina tumida]